MKTCPFCAEDIQAAAVVCKHCGRDLVNADTAQKVQIVEPKKKTGCFTWAVVIVFALLIMGWCSSMNTTPRSALSPSEPDEPCTVEAPATARAAAQNWCADGIFTHVNVSSDSSNFIVVLQFSNKGQRSWTNAKLTLLNNFRRLTDEMVEKTDMNVAFSLHGTDGNLLGGCARRRGSRESVCN